MFCDLHTHSTFSDGTFSPTEIVLKAKEIGLDAVALCDHNTVAGLDEFVSAGKKYGVITVAGIEFSTEYNSKQLHIVGLFIKKENYSDITEIMAESQKLKEESNKLLVKNLAKDGYILDYDEIKNSTVDGFVNRAKHRRRSYAEGLCFFCQRGISNLAYVEVRLLCSAEKAVISVYN